MGTWKKGDWAILLEDAGTLSKDDVFRVSRVFAGMGDGILRLAHGPAAHGSACVLASKCARVITELEEGWRCTNAEVVLVSPGRIAHGLRMPLSEARNAAFMVAVLEDPARTEAAMQVNDALRAVTEAQAVLDKARKRLAALS